LAGIAGIIHRGGRPERDEVERLSQGIAHRGSASELRFDEGPATLVQRNRRAGLTLASSQRTVLVLDGRLTRLESGEASSEAGRLLSVLEQGGPEALAQIDGVFAFAAWDRREQALTLGRDAFGTRPLFWTRRWDALAFASEIPALLALPWVGRDVAHDHLAEYLSFRYVHAPRTLLRDVHAVPPGHVLRVDARGPRLQRWWHPAWSPDGASIPPDRETAARVEEALRRAVARQSVEGPVGVLLSGGLDSSSILYHARDAGRPPLALTVSLASDPTDESPFAGRVARVLGVEHHLLRVDDRALVDQIDAATAAMGQPLPTSAAALQSLMYRDAASRVRALLSGDGGDEILGGRSIEKIARRLKAARALTAMPPGLRGLGRLVARRAGRPEIALEPRHFGLQQLIGGSAVFDQHAREALLSDPALVRRGLRRQVLEPLYGEVNSDAINEVLHVWQRGWLPEDSLARSDRMAARAGLEVRYPLLDRDLVRIAEALPGEAKVRDRLLGSGTKWPLRKAMEGKLPADLLHRPKRASLAPLDHWLRAAGADFLRDRTGPLIAERDGLFRSDELRRLVAEHLSGVAGHGLKLWTVILFDTWRRSLL